MKFERICVVGLGYIGLPTAVMFAQTGRIVIGVDTNVRIVEMIRQGHSPIIEPHLESALQQVVEQQRLFVTQCPAMADVFIIAVPTPFTPDHQPNLRYVEQAVQSIAPYLSQGNLVVLESTSPVGTTEKVAQWLAIARPDLAFPTDISLAYCPERVLPGRIMQELIENDRVIGGLSSHCATQAVALYQLFAKGQCLTTNARTAEMCKLAENSFRDVNIAFANELSLVCDQLNIDVWELIRLANHHPRVQILQPGAGVGGHCIAVDPWFLVASAPHLTSLIQVARQVNDHKPYWVIEKVKATVADWVIETGRSPQQLKIACLGLTFKADVSDLRESPALMIANVLADWHQGELWVVEPNLKQLPDTLLQRSVSLVSLDDALKKADILVLLVDHSPFKQKGLLTHQRRWLVDTRGVWHR